MNQVYAPVGHGEEVRICGNVPALGCNNPIRSIPLITTSSDYPIWYTKEGISIINEHFPFNLLFSK